MDTKILDLCEDSIREQLFPGCVVGVLRAGKTTILPAGKMTYDTSSRLITTDTAYDVASITKSIPTSCLILHLVERGLLALDDTLITYVPELANRYRTSILIRHLLTYTVVFDIPGGLSRVAKEKPHQILESIFAADLRGEPGQTYYYTNPPAVLMGLIIERITNMPLNEYANEVFGSLNMHRTSFSSGWVGAQSVAPTEIDWRGEIQGTPHDESAWILRQAGKVAGHAGLFSTAPDLLIFAQMLLDNGTYMGRRYFSEETVTSMHTNQIAELGHSAGLGWELNWPEIMGNQGSTEKFGKTGFTGCLIVMDPVSKRAMVHLSNRTYPHRKDNKQQLNSLRRKLCDLVFA